MNNKKRTIPRVCVLTRYTLTLVYQSTSSVSVAAAGWPLFCCSVDTCQATTLHACLIFVSGTSIHAVWLQSECVSMCVDACMCEQREATTNASGLFSSAVMTGCVTVSLSVCVHCGSSKAHCCGRCFLWHWGDSYCSLLTKCCKKVEVSRFSLLQFVSGEQHCFCIALTEIDQTRRSKRKFSSLDD